MQPGRRGSVVDIALQRRQRCAGGIRSRAKILDRLRIGDNRFPSTYAAAAIAVC